MCTRYATSGNVVDIAESSQETSASASASASASLYFTSGSRWSFELDECTSPEMLGGSASGVGDATSDHANNAARECADFRMEQSGMRQNCVIIASEPLNVYTDDWVEVPHNTLVLVSSKMNVLMFPI